VGAYYGEELRRMLVARFGDQAVLEGGLRVDVAMNPKLQAAAEKALRDGLETVDRRMGYRGPLAQLPPERFAQLKTLIERRIAEAGKRAPDQVTVADLGPLAEALAGEPRASAGEDEGAEARPELNAEGEAPPSPDEVLARRAALRPLSEGLRLAGFVTRVDDAKKRAEVDLVGRTAALAFSTMTWARPRGVGKWTPPPQRLSDVLKPGQVVRLKVLKVPPTGPLEAQLDQVPEVQGALVALDPATRHVVAMVGGYDFARSAFNRATQAKRQPGSAFKAFLYAAAVGSQKYTPVSIVNDAPETIRDPYTGKAWKPQNYERSGFDGPMTLRAALTKSKNTVSVRLIEALTPQAAIDFAGRAGIRSPMPDNLTLALGTGEVMVLELTNAYATLHSLGQYAEPIVLVRVTDAEGRVVEEHHAAFEETMPPSTAYLATSLMQSVVEEGTATQVKELGRPAAGKTGTASEYRDAWFAGYTRDFVATAWVGFDNHDSLGNGETGGRAALPIWLDFMKAAHQDLPPRDFEVPPGIVQVRVDPLTGLLAGSSVPGRLEPFLEGTAPTVEAPPPGQMTPDDFFFQDARRPGSRR
jgi:penicillin-binding protein 1A